VVDGAYFNAQHTAPPLTFRVGQEVYISLTNVNTNHRPDLFDPHTVHWHGFPQAAPIFDGVPESSATINGGSTLTYYYKVNDEGTFMYHCHVESTEHMQMGMLGSLSVLPATWPTAQLSNTSTTDLRPVLGRLATGTTPRFAYGNTAAAATVNQKADAVTSAYDVEYTIQLGAFDQNFHRKHEQVQGLPFAEMRATHPMLNGRGYPDTVDPGAGPETQIPEDVNGRTHFSQPVSALIRVAKNRKALVRIHNLNEIDYHTITIQGIPMTVVGYGAAVTRGMTTDASGAFVAGGANWSYRTTTVTLGGGESADVVLDTTNVPAGTYFLYSSNLNLLSNGSGEDRGGLMTHVVVE
jgi:FtsP/CotA-like multicopper oxidase with cupredoxin domain